MTRKRKTVPKRGDRAQAARELHAAEPDLTHAQIGERIGSTRQAVARALAYQPSGVKTGPKPRAKCEHCGGTGRVA